MAELAFSIGIITGVKDDIDAAKTKAKLSSAFVSQSTRNVQVVLAAACVVFAHSVADDVFSECCSIAIDSDGKGWSSELDKAAKCL